MWGKERYDIWGGKREREKEGMACGKNGFWHLGETKRKHGNDLWSRARRVGEALVEHMSGGRHGKAEEEEDEE